MIVAGGYFSPGCLKIKALRALYHAFLQLIKGLFMRKNGFYGQIASDFKAFTLEIRKKLTRLNLQCKRDLPPFAH